MASIFVTGSSDGIGRETARQLIADGHRVVLHARDEARAKDTLATHELEIGASTQVWLAAGGSPVTGRFFKWKRELRANPEAYDESLQEALLDACAALTDVRLGSN